MGVYCEHGLVFVGFSLHPFVFDIEVQICNVSLLILDECGCKLLYYIYISPSL